MKNGPQSFNMVAIGTSAGGFDAICKLITQLPGTFEIPVAIVQHRAKESEALASLLQDCSALNVIDVEDKQPIEPRTVYIAPPDYHLLIDEGAFSLSTEGPVAFSRPSIDVFFESAADAYGPGVIGVVLTGANSDGSKGLQKIVSQGGLAVVQDPKTAEVDVMPASAVRAVKRARVLSLDGIAQHLMELEHLHRVQNASQVAP